jgi:hypothetical protein
MMKNVMKIMSSKGGEDDEKKRLKNIYSRIDKCVKELVNYDELIKGKEWVENDEKKVIEENELMGDEEYIDDEEKKLERMRNRRYVKEDDERMKFDEMILEEEK